MDYIIARLEQFENEDFDQSPQWVDRATGEGSDFTGSTFEMDIKAAGNGEGSAQASATIGTADIDEGIIRIQVADGLLGVGEYIYDLVRINGGARTVLMTGVYAVVQGVSQP